MKLKQSLLLLGLLTGLLGSGYAMADHRGHASIGVYVGPGFGPYYPRPHPYWGPYYYPYPYYPYPPPVVVAPPPAAPPVYVEQAPQQQTQAAPQAPTAQQDNADGYWYHCSQPEGYYPYVKECPAGWQRETPKPPPQQQGQ